MNPPVLNGHKNKLFGRFLVIVLQAILIIVCTQFNERFLLGEPHPQKDELPVVSFQRA